MTFPELGIKYIEMVRQVKVQFLQHSHVEYSISIDTRLQSKIYELAESLIEPHSSVLDLGCGDGTFLKRLEERKNAKGVGVEISHEGVVKCLAKGLTVFQGDVDEGLKDYGDNAFDYVTLLSTIQMLFHPDLVLFEMIRVGKKAIVSFPNYGYWKNRLRLLRGLTPVYRGTSWYSTPNIHNLTIKDFLRFCRENNIKVGKFFLLSPHGKLLKTPFNGNLVASDAIFELWKE